jgi:hypothetical protein
MAPIKGGLDDKQAPVRELQDQEQFDESLVVESPAEEDCFTPTNHERIQAPAQVNIAPSKAESYLKKRTRVTLELKETEMTLSAIDVIMDRCSITILLPMTSDSGTVVPKPGIDLKVITDGETYACYYPGTKFEVPALGLAGMVCVRASDGD